MSTMLLGGLWHGAAGHFVLWGGIQGIWLALERARGRRSLYPFLPGPLEALVTFTLFACLLVVFRADGLGAAAVYYQQMAGLAPVQEGAALIGAVTRQPYHLLALAVSAGVIWLAPQSWDFTKQLDVSRVAWALALLWISSAMLFAQAYNPFIYFIF